MFWAAWKWCTIVRHVQVCSHKYRLMALLDYSRFKLWFKQHLSGNLLSQSEQGSDFLSTNTAPLNSQWSTVPLDWWGGLSQESLTGSQAKWVCATCGNVTLNYVAWCISKLEVIVNDKRSAFMFTEVHRGTSLWHESIQDLYHWNPSNRQQRPTGGAQVGSKGQITGQSTFWPSPVARSCGEWPKQ